VAIPKVMGIETEYGLTVPATADFNPVLTSSVLINSYVAAELRRVRWDYEEETPLRDARGFETAMPAGAVSDEDLGLANVILTNGARYYVDHAHPEYSTPECTNPRDVVVYDRAGELILERSAERAVEAMAAGTQVLVYKNNTDNKGVSYGTHENYLVARAVPFPRIVRQITPHFVTRQIYCGAGLLGGGNRDARSGPGREPDRFPYQISQRADFFEVEVGLETTLKRPIVNTRDEPHADPEKYRRLHVIIGDANMSEVATYLKTGVTAIVLMMIEDDAIADDLAFDRPVEALHEISHDLHLAKTYELKDGRSLRAVEVQWAYHEMAQKYLARADAPTWAMDVMSRWEATLAALERDPMTLDTTVDWVAKYKAIDSYRERHDLVWDDPRLHMLDLQYHDVRRDKGIAKLLERKGRLERLSGDEEVRRAVDAPPPDTRAYFRGRCLAQFAGDVAAASWDSVIFDLGADSLQRIPMQEPLRGTETMVKELLDRCTTAEALLAELRA